MIWNVWDVLKNKDYVKIGDDWVPARPINWKYRSLRKRLYEAWLVFMGKADPLVWPKNQ